jgi:hypothetical protein
MSIQITGHTILERKLKYLFKHQKMGGSNNAENTILE